MTRRFRQFVFWIFALFFILTSGAIFLFAQGWGFDFSTFKFAKTGGIFIETSSPGAKIYVNDEYIKSTSGLLSYGRLVSGLLPNYYNVFVYKDGYYPWNKSVEVKEGLVAEIKNIVLFPIELSKTKIAQLPNQAVSGFSVKNGQIEIINKKQQTYKIYDFSGKIVSSGKQTSATSSKEIISPDKDKKLFARDGKLWIEYLRDVKDEPAKAAGELEVVAEYEPPILFFDWLDDSEHVIWYASGEMAITERDSRGGKRNTVKFYLDVDSPVFFDRENYDFYFLYYGEKIAVYKINLLEQ